jgi:hypothetical protein
MTTCINSIKIVTFVGEEIPVVCSEEGIKFVNNSMINVNVSSPSSSSSSSS